MEQGLRRLWTLALAVVATCAGVLAAPVGASAAVANPNLNARCGLNVMVVLDESGSIADTSGATTAVRNGAMAFVRSLKDTGSKVAMVEFNTEARKVFNYTTVTSANAAETSGSLFYGYLYNDPTSTNPDYNPAGYSGNDRATNWEAALDQVVAANNGTGAWAGNTTDADLVVFITDGNPTAWLDNSGDPQVTFGSFSQTALDEAIPKADAVKTQGSHMFVVGVGDALSDASSQAHIADISGTDKYPSPNPTFSQGDYTLVTNFSDLETALKNIATELCKSSVTITKQVDNSDGQGYNAANGWTFTGNVSVNTGTFQWVQPAGLNPQSAATSGAGTVTFQWKPDTPSALSQVIVSETQQPGYSVTDVACSKNGNAIANVPDTETFTLTGLAVTDVTTCTVKNKRDTGTITLNKAWTGGDPGQTTLQIGTSAGGSQVGTQQTGAAGAAPLTTGAKTVTTGTYYVSETGGLANYNGTLACTKNGNAYAPGANSSVVVGKNDVVVCTYTNARKKGSVELVKAWTGGDPGQTTLNIGTSAGGSQVDTQQTGAAGAAPLTTGANSVNTGTYYVSETGGLANYNGTLACTKNGNAYTPGANSSVVVSENDVVVCTYTNARKKGSVELVKAWTGTDPGQTTLQIGTSVGGTQVDTQQTGAAGASPLTTGSNSVATGTYYVSESGGLANYNGTLACTKNGNAYTPGANDSVVVGENDVVVCTYTNARKKASIELKKAWTGTDPGQTTLQIGTSAGGNQVDTQQTGAAGAAPLSTGANSVNTGTYYVSETGGLANYNGTLACTKNGNAYTPGANDSVVVSENDVVVCTYTNARKKGSVELVKSWTGGDPGQTTLNIGTSAGGNQVDTQQTGVAGAAPLTTGSNSVNTGTYYVSETGGLTNYNSTLACTKNGNAYTPGANDAVVVGENDVVVCTFTNARKKASVELKKSWTGGDPGQTTLQIGTSAGGNQVDTQQTGAAGAAPLTTGANSVNTGTYYVSETGGLANYDGSLACKKNGQDYTPGANDAVVVGENDVVVCTFTNARKTGTVQVKKLWAGGDAGQTTLKIGTGAGGDSVTSQQTGANGAAPLETDVKTVATGTYYVSEAGGLADHDSLLACKKNGQDYTPGANDSVTVGKDDAVVCTFTNTRKTGKLTLVKHLIGGGSDRFSLKVDGVAQTVSPGGGTAFGHNDSTGQMTKNTGTYTISEDAISPAADADYVEELSCVNGTAPADTDGTITIGKNDNWVCTFTNTRKQGSIELKKSWTGGDPGQTTLKIGTSAGGGSIANQQTGPNGTGTQSTGTKTVDTGAYYVSEDGGLANFDSSLACKKNGQDYTPGANGQVDVGLRDAVVCTYTNDRHRGTIEVKKQWVGPGSGGQTTLKIGTSAGGSQVDSQQTGANGGAPLTTDAESVVTGTYYVSESGGLDDFDSSLACKKNGQDYTPGANDSVTVGKNDTVVCTFTNTRKQGTVQVKKVWTGDEPGQTTLQIGTGAGGDSVTSQQTGANGAAPLETDVKTVPTGTYYVSETGGLTNHTGSLACKKNGQDYTPGANDSVTVGKDDAVVCTFTNTRKTGTIQVKKIWSGPGSGGQTTLNIGTTLNGSETTSQPTGANGGTPLATDVKTVPTGDYYVSETGGLSDYNASLACERDGQPYIYGAGNRVSVGKDEDIVCTFTNARKSGTLVLEKSLRPSNNSDQFNLRYDGTAATVDSQAGGTAFGDGDRSTQIKLATGVPVTLTETAVSPADLGDYDRSLYCWSNYDESGGFTPENNVITLRENEFLNCTWTNVKKARVTIKKVVSNPVEGDGPAFGFTTTLPDHPGGEGNQPIVAGEPNTFSLKNGQQTSVKVSTANGPFVVSEDDASGIDPGYLLTSIECTGQSAPPDVRLSLKEAESATAQQRSTTIEPQPGDEITCTFTNKRIVAVDIVVKKPETQAVYIDGTATYTYEVTNTGTSDLTDIAVADDKCSPVSGPNTGTDATPAVLNPGDTWTYSCSISAAALFGQTTAPITNTVTVTARDELGRDVPPSTDTAITKLLVPGIAIDKTVNAASQNAQAGDAITFDIVVTNTGNTSMVTVAVSDDLCPANLSGPDKGSDGSPATLDPGESWRYSCVVQTTAAQQGTAIRNVATVTGTDTGGKQPTATDDATQALPAVVTGGGGTEGQGVVNGRSRLTGTAGCVKSAYGTATVSGSNIAKVVFYVNGKKTKTLTKPNSGKNYRLKLRAKSLKYGNYKITARVTYVTGATPKSATLDRQFSRCRPKVAVTPKFTG
ncbi:MAG: hypothetical protein V9E83_10445 [Baekduia sp.]